MCGRYMITSSVEALRQLFHFEERPNLAPRYNVAPTQAVPIVRRSDDGGRQLAMARWGLVPFWAKDLKVGYRMINARAETVAEKPAFRAAFKARRCLIPADGFYEWKAEAGGKQPYLIRLESSEPFAFAGLWERWTEPESGERIESCAIIVTSANELVARVHDRMPVILAPNDHDPWLYGESERDDLQQLLAPYPAEAMTACPVSKAVNSPKNDGPELIEPVGEELRS